MKTRSEKQATQMTKLIRIHRGLLAVFIAAAMVSYGSSAHAQSGTWSSTGGGDWTDTTKWTSGTVASGTDNTATLNGITNNSVINLNTPITIGHISALDATHNYTISGNNTLTLDTTTGIPSISVGTAARTLTISSEIQGSDGLNKIGAGTLLLSGSNTYSGGTTLTAGTIAIGHDNALGTGTITFSGGILASSDSTAHTITNRIAFNNTIFISGTGDLTFSDTSVTPLGANRIFGIYPGARVTFAQIISGGNGITRNTGVASGNTGTLVLSGMNTYTSYTIVSAGTVVAGTNAPSGSPGAFGNTTEEIQLGYAVSNYDAILLTGGAFTIGRIIRNKTQDGTDTGTRVLTLGGETAHNSVFSGAIYLGDASKTSKGLQLTAVAGGQVTFSGVIQDPTGQDATEAAAAAALTAVTKVGAGTVILSGVNTYTGKTAVNEGTLALGANSTLNTNNNVALVDGILSGGVYTNTVGTLTLSGDCTIALGSGRLSFTSGAGDWSAYTLTLTGTLEKTSKCLRFGTSPSGLTEAQLARITYNGKKVMIDADGYIYPFPPGTVITFR